MYAEHSSQEERWLFECLSVTAIADSFLPMQNSARDDDDYKTVFYIIFGQHCTPFSFGVQ